MFIKRDNAGSPFPSRPLAKDLRLYAIVPPPVSLPSVNQESSQNDQESLKPQNFSTNIHQRLQNIEKKLRQFKILQTDNQTKSATSASNEGPSSRFHETPNMPVVSNVPMPNDLPRFNNNCHTSPLPRRPLPLFVDKNSTPRRRDFEFLPQNSVDGCNVSPSPRKSVDNADTQRRIDAIMNQTNVLKCNGKEYKMFPEDLELIGDLGHGVCGHVVKMKHKESGLLMAVKQMRRSGNKDENKQIIMDLEVVLRSHDCPYIVQCLGCFVTDVEVWICMELMDTCMDKLMQRTHKAVPESIIGKVSLSIVKALRYLKDNLGVIHRDVKPSNILLNCDGTIKLCDFGISGRLVDSKAATQTAGCAAYMAPERIQPPDPRNANYDVRADVWSLGISLVEMALGRFPYGVCENHFEILTKILLTDSPTLSPKDGFTPTFCDFLSQCLAKDFNKRPKYPQLLQHPFLILYETKYVDVAGWLVKQLAE